MHKYIFDGQVEMKRKFQPVITHENELTTIKDLISENPEGLNIKQISEFVYMNRNSVAKYLNMLMMSGQVELRQVGNSKLYYPSHRVPVSSILNFSSELVVFIDQHHDVVQVNNPFLEFAGISEDDIIDHGISELDIPVLNDPSIQRSIERVLEGTDVESEIVVKVSGVVTFFRVNLIPIVFDDGSNGAAVFLRDITDQKHVENALNESEERYRNIVETQTEFITRFLPDGTHIFVNEAYCRYFGKMREEIIGSKFRPKIPPEEMLRLKHHFAALTPQNPSASIEHRVFMSDGSERWQMWSDKAIFDRKGSLIEYQSVGRDTTENKKNEDAFQDIEQMFNILQASPFPTYVIDQDHRIIFWNRALEALSGIDAGSMLGTRQHWKVFYRTDRPCLSDLLVDNARDRIHEWYAGKYTESCLADEACEVVDYFPDLGDSGKWLRITSVPITGSSGESVGVRETLEDISENKGAEEKVKELENQFLQLTAFLEESVFTVDSCGFVTSWNNAMEELTGIAAKDMIGMGDYEYSIPFYKSRRPLLINLIFDSMDEMEKNGYTNIRKEGCVIVAESRINGQDGQNRILLARAAPLHDDRGRHFGAFESIRDITMERYNETILSQNEDKYKELAEMLPIGAYEMDKTGHIVWTNSKALDLFGYTENDLKSGINIYQLFMGEDRKKMIDELKSNEKSPEGGFRYTALKKDGTSFQIRVRSVPVISDGMIKGRRGIILT